MSFMTGHELCQAVEEHLATLGYRVFGDSSDGWTWELGEYEPQLPPCDSQGEAAAAALADLVQRTDELLNAAEAVVERWERGDLAAAVRELDLCLKALRDRTDEAVEAETVEIDDSVDGWLLHGDGPTGPWTVGAYLDLDDAHEAALAKAHAWVEEGHHVDLEHFALTLTQHKFIHVVGLDASVWIDPLPIKSA